MKKLLYSLAAIVFTAFTLSSCEDVPAPYELPEDNNGSNEETPGEYLHEAFATSMGKFKVITQMGTSWKIDFKTAKASGYDNNSKKNTPSESYLISPEINLSKSKGAYLKFEYIIQYMNRDGVDKVLITSNYTGDPTKTEWEDITGKLTQGTDWTTFATYAKNLPAAYIGKDKVHIAFYYSATNKGSRTWEVKNVTVKEGEVTENPETPDEPKPDVLKPVNGTYINESFATSFGVFNAIKAKGLPWFIDFKTAKATSYDSGSKKTTPSEAYIVSKPMDMTASKGAHVSFEYILRYATFNGKPKEGVANQVLVTDEYTGDPLTTKWTDITGTLKEGIDWKPFYKFSANLPKEMQGKGKVVIALRYACNANSATWEVKNLTVKEGTVSEGGTPDEPSVTPDAGESITIQAANMKFEDKKPATSYTYTDGTVITFGQGEGTTPPAYYGPNYAAVRLYAKNTMIIKAKKTIVSVSIKTTDGFKGKLYNGNDKAYMLNGTTQVPIKKVNDTNVKFEPLSNSTVTLVNDFTENKGGTQLRISAITITYAK
ncbi:choice-of-anchor J domain-containing protein [Hoylesella timonensis]